MTCRHFDWMLQLSSGRKLIVEEIYSNLRIELSLWIYVLFQSQSSSGSVGISIWPAFRSSGSNPGWMLHLINAILQFDWPLHVSGTSPRIWTCDTRPLLLAWAGWGLGTRLRVSSPLKKKKRHLETRTMCSVFICTAQSGLLKVIPQYQTVFFHVYQINIFTQIILVS